ncbi:TPP enzyme family protein [Pleurotus pulmonarius]
MRRQMASSSPSRSPQLGVARAPINVPREIDIPSQNAVSRQGCSEFVGRCGAQIVRDVLIRNGVQHAFAYSGGANIHLTDSICTDGRIKVFLPRHEQGAGHMAEGYARVTGRPGVVSVTSGPGATNMITPLQDAMSDGIPMIVLAGQVSVKDLGTGAFQDADIVRMTQPCTKWATMVECVEDLPDCVDEAFRVATSGRPGPVLLSIPRDVFEATWRDGRPVVRNLTTPSYPPPRASERLVPIGFRSINEAATIINGSEKPLIIAGAGILSSPQGPHILSELAVRGNIPVATTLHGLGAFDEDHPLSLHMLGFHGSVYGNYAAQSADTIIVLGARLDERVTANLDKFAVAARAAGKDGRGGILHFEIQPQKSNRIIDTRLSVLGDVTESLKILAPLIERRARASWLAQIQAWKTKFPFTYEPSAPGQRVKPQEVIEELDRQTADAKDQPRSLITSGALATMGFGLPAAIGAKVADPSKIVVDIDGDASFLMSGMELATAAEYGIGVKVLIFNNNVQGMVYRWQKIFYDSRHTLTRMVNPDFVMLAQSMGVRAIQCETSEELPRKMKEFLEYDNHRPIVMVCQVDEEEELYPIVPPGKALHELMMHPSLPFVQP